MLYVYYFDCKARASREQSSLFECRGAAEFRDVMSITAQSYDVFPTNPNLKQHKSCLKRYNFKILFVLWPSVEDTHARKCSNKFGVLLAYSYLCPQYVYTEWIFAHICRRRLARKRLGRRDVLPGNRWGANPTYQPAAWVPVLLRLYGCWQRVDDDSL